MQNRRAINLDQATRSIDLSHTMFAEQSLNSVSLQESNPLTSVFIVRIADSLRLPKRSVMNPHS